MNFARLTDTIESTWMTTEITDVDVKRLVGWDKIVAPLIVMAIAGGLAFSIKAQETFSGLKADHTRYDENNVEIKQRMDQILAEQRILRDDVTKAVVYQERFKEEMKELKQQNADILKILRTKE